MSIAGQRGNPVLLMTDEFDISLSVLDLGSILMNGDIFKFRLWNNRDTFAGVPKAVGINLVLKASPKSGHTILINDALAVRGRATYSAKLDAPVVEGFKNFPLSDTDYDEIPVGMYNEYEVQLDGTNLIPEHQAILNGTEWKVYIVTQYTSGGLE